MIEPKTCDGDQIDGPPSYSDRAGGCDRDRGGRRGATGDGGRRSVVAACGASGIGTSDAGVFAGVAVAVTGTAPARNPVVAGGGISFVPVALVVPSALEHQRIDRDEIFGRHTPGRSTSRFNFLKFLFNWCNFLFSPP